MKTHVTCYLGDANDAEDTTGLFENQGSSFFYRVVFEDDTFSIEDTVGRRVPLDNSIIKSLSTILLFMDAAEADNIQGTFSISDDLLLITE